MPRRYHDDDVVRDFLLFDQVALVELPVLSAASGGSSPFEVPGVPEELVC